MRFRCLITYRSARSKAVSSWQSHGRGRDHASIAADMISELRRKQRRVLTIISVMVYDRDAAAYES